MDSKRLLHCLDVRDLNTVILVRATFDCFWQLCLLESVMVENKSWNLC